MKRHQGGLNESVYLNSSSRVKESAPLVKLLFSGWDWLLENERTSYIGKGGRTSRWVIGRQKRKRGECSRPKCWLGESYRTVPGLK